jgi:cytochrome b involved in lipid metabolism
MKKYFLGLLILSAAIFLTACGTAKTQPATPAAVKPGLTLAVVATHNTADDCWMVINNNIYNVTDYIANHPGGEKTMTDYCGKDATTAFETKGGSGKTHSDQARQILQQFYIGDLAR